MLWPQIITSYVHMAFLHIACGWLKAAFRRKKLSQESAFTQTQGYSENTTETYRIGGRQQAPLDKSFKCSLQNKVLLRDGLLGNLLCWQCLHMLRNTEQVRLFQVTVTTCYFQLNQVGLLASLAQLFFPCGCVEVTLSASAVAPSGEL